MKNRIVVCGGGGFIEGHTVKTFLMNSEITEPVNLGNDEMVSINQFVYLERNYKSDTPKNARGCSGDNAYVFSISSYRRISGTHPRSCLINVLSYDQIKSGISKNSVYNPG
jgi:hypothetical protein